MNTKTTLIAIAALMMAACTQLDNPGEERIPVALAYTTVEATETKAAQNLNEGTFASGESVKVCIHNTSTDDWMDYNFTTGSAGTMSPTNAVPYYPAGSQNIDIVAYYPSTAGPTFSVVANQTYDVNYKASDLMFASVTNQEKQAEPVNLAFTHKMAKIKVNITPGTGVSNIQGVSLLNVKPTVLFSHTLGAVGAATGSAITIAMSNNGAAVIPAQTIDGGLLSIVTDKGTATYTVTDKAFVAGRQYTINITVNLRAIGTTTAITGWTSQGTVTVNAAPMDVTCVTAEHVGWLIADDGSIYPTVSDIPAGKSAKAMICYVGSPGSADTSGSYRGLAISLKDTSASKWCQGYSSCLYSLQSDNWDAAKGYMNGIASTYELIGHFAYVTIVDDRECNHIPMAAMVLSSECPAAPTGTSGWFMPSIGQWRVLLAGLLGGDGLTTSAQERYNSEAVNAKLAAAGIDTSASGVALDGDYWSSTEKTTGLGSSHQPNTWIYRSSDGCAAYINKGSVCPTRPVIAF
jgi:hypothetical protein